MSGKFLQSPLTKKSIDCSDLAVFSFCFFCDCCGRKWISKPVQFEQGGFTGIDNEEVRKIIWIAERTKAFEQGNLEAQLNFNFCRKCDLWVCDDCFDAEEDTCVVCGK